MNKTRKLTEVEKVLIERDGLSPEEAFEQLKEMRELIYDGEDPEELLYDIGLEPDFIFDLIWKWKKKNPNKMQRGESPAFLAIPK